MYFIWPLILVLLSASSGCEQQSDGLLKSSDAVARSLPELIYQSSEHFTDVESANLDGLMTRIGDARIVLLGESTHGSAEFYAMRARITRALIENKGFNLVALEGDWPDVSSIDHYVRNTGHIPRYTKPPFSDFPRWMWLNESFQAFADWLKTHNQKSAKAHNTVHVYGLDFYNMHSSMEAVLDYLYSIDPAAAQMAKWRYQCLLADVLQPSNYTRKIEAGEHPGCEQEVGAVWQDLRSNQVMYRQSGGERYFQAEQNARLVKNAERFYRTNYLPSNESRLVRHENLFESLQQILSHHGSRSKIVVWAHNSHIGDARATDFGRQGEANIGQRVRQFYGADAYIIGFGTDHGSVTAADGFGMPDRVMQLQPSHEDSYGGLFHEVEAKNFMLPLRDPLRTITRTILLPERLQRAIGTAYDPADEFRKHYFYASLPQQFDEFIWFDETQAVKRQLIVNSE